MYYYSRLLKPRIFPVWALIVHYKVLFRLIKTESLIFGKTFQLRPETSIIISNYTYILLLLTFENCIFSPFGPY